MYASIFWRTAAELWSPYVAVAVAAAQIGDYRVSFAQGVVGIVVSILGATVAVLSAIRWGPSATRLEKALRSAAEKLVIGLPTIAVVTLADILTLPRILWPVTIGAVGAFALTWLMNPPATTPAQPAG